MKNNLLRGLLFLFFISHFSKISAQTDEQIVTNLDFYIQKAIVDWQTPGLAVAVVKDGKVILSKGYGVRELGKSERVNGQTIFACASTTKAMTALALGILVDEGKLNWTDKVVQHLPDFKVNDPFITNELSVQFTSQLSATLEHWHYDTFKAVYNKGWFPSDLFGFNLDESGMPRKLKSGSSVWKRLL